ncbi:MAG: desulfoferrodoxin [Candidatus Komeilibacteria bacterium CG11_big_fil_rev_8_21_14_0_20_36_20]|uniref:Desulfoferrodoxin n=1 Tax=Candidatus Komeilibacteria bacterium CG11_big_fil_rev_8_21_14_0_20_36_20 TaxID=1974477 RepID=A0A2H0NEK8_9BACT|nr:MAG: desulfoferrodoxin [Candidatus Komeilibacteria bacterium CG11_big_fil_rev_8_21_14_0_20_36_20]PIR81550.1 MAG: desulfoferrodoxin [Candidatus Komeilibacteria bacterium CG10_big_fil_rev_8_21_14_0_10_36_65]PJC55458.1 MAG: desulfoferrodoxin [Candidatus Komeilibacteria bacterium CG_4_9_14_0_2_um_filter_36_13]
MTQQNQIYKCEVCGNVVEVLHASSGQLTCCGQAMILIKEKAKEEGREKHLPFAKKLSAQVCHGGDGLQVQIGETIHPMEPEHYIEWIEIITADGKRGKKFLKPGEKPEVEFHTRSHIKELRTYCNIHGLWKITL